MFDTGQSLTNAKRTPPQSYLFLILVRPRSSSTWWEILELPDPAHFLQRMKALLLHNICCFEEWPKPPRDQKGWPEPLFSCGSRAQPACIVVHCSGRLSWICGNCPSPLEIEKAEQSRGSADYLSHSCLSNHQEPVQKAKNINLGTVDIFNSVSRDEAFRSLGAKNVVLQCPLVPRSNGRR